MKSKANESNDVFGHFSRISSILLLSPSSPAVEIYKFIPIVGKKKKKKNKKK